MNNNTAEKLAKYGLTGVCIALIILLGFTSKLFYNFATNHVSNLMNVIERSTETDQKLIGAVENLDKTLQTYLNK